MTKRWDIFCKIVDNYGDIGVCWRLAQQLANEHYLQVRLFVDLPEIAQKIIPKFNPQLSQQLINGVLICTWIEADNLLFNDTADVVIEAFACGLPAQYIATMQLQLVKRKYQHTKWLNLEYLSAEKWVADFHAKPSIHPTTGLTKTYFFSGFTKATGGLSREKALITQRDNFIQSQQLIQTNISLTKQIPKQSVLNISLFCYPNAPVNSALQVFAKSATTINLYVPDSLSLKLILQTLSLEDYATNNTHIFKKNNLTIHVLPFLSQDQYDELLWRCDVNFVRGEDSWLRAIWAAKPMIWQPYFQNENTHLLKLNAFLNHYCAAFNSSTEAAASQAIKLLSGAWVNPLTTAASFSHAWFDYTKALPIIKIQAQIYTQKLALQPSLVSNLVDFCNQ